MYPLAAASARLALPRAVKVSQELAQILSRRGTALKDVPALTRHADCWNGIHFMSTVLYMKSASEK